MYNDYPINNFPADIDGLGINPVVANTFLVVYIAIIVLIIVSMWKIYQKAGKPGWASIIPIYNLVVMFQIAGLSPWLILLGFVPVINIIVAIILVYKFAHVFGKGPGFTIGMIFLPFIFYPILAFGKSQYVGPHISLSVSDVAAMTNTTSAPVPPSQPPQPEIPPQQPPVPPQI